jgi:hypothetical protein
VDAESKSIEMQIDPDARLAAAAGGAARYLADAAGLANAAVAELQNCIVAACREAFEHLHGDHPHLAVTITCFSDRIEVSLAYVGAGSPAIGLERIAGLSPQHTDAASVGEFLRGIDRLQYEVQGQITVTRLTKYFGIDPEAAYSSYS